MDKPTPSPEEKAAVISLAQRLGLRIDDTMSAATVGAFAVVLLQILAGPQPEQEPQ